jgi:hypothetical protein
MNVVIFNTQCKMDVRAIQKYSSLSITCCVSLTWKEMDAACYNPKCMVLFSNPKWMLVCIPGWRGIFLSQHVYEHAKYIWMPIWMVDWDQPKVCLIAKNSLCLSFWWRQRSCPGGRWSGWSCTCWCFSTSSTTTTASPGIPASTLLVSSRGSVDVTNSYANKGPCPQLGFAVAWLFQVRFWRGSTFAIPRVLQISCDV